MAPGTDNTQQFPAWVQCPCCDNMFCTIHDMHAFECPCPPIDELDFDPYTEGGKPIEGITQ